MLGVDRKIRVVRNDSFGGGQGVFENEIAYIFIRLPGCPRNQRFSFKRSSNIEPLLSIL